MSPSLFAHVPYKHCLYFGSLPFVETQSSSHLLIDAPYWQQQRFFSLSSFCCVVSLSLYFLFFFSLVSIVCLSEAERTMWQESWHNFGQNYVEVFEVHMRKHWWWSHWRLHPLIETAPRSWLNPICSISPLFLSCWDRLDAFFILSVSFPDAIVTPQMKGWIHVTGNVDLQSNFSSFLLTSEAALITSVNPVQFLFHLYFTETPPPSERP